MKVKALLYVAFPVMVLGALYAVLKPQRAAESTRVSPAPPALVAAEGAISASPAAATPATDEVRVHHARPNAFDIVVHGGKLTPERTATLRFTAKLTGRFGYELHRSGLQLGALEVYPQ